MKHIRYFFVGLGLLVLMIGVASAIVYIITQLFTLAIVIVLLVLAYLLGKIHQTNKEDNGNT
jgi:uncharacterized membrane protein